MLYGNRTLPSTRESGDESNIVLCMSVCVPRISLLEGCDVSNLIRLSISYSMLLFLKFLWLFTSTSILPYMVHLCDVPEG